MVPLYSITYKSLLHGLGHSKNSTLSFSKVPDKFLEPKAEATGPGHKVF